MSAITQPRAFRARLHHSRTRWACLGVAIDVPVARRFFFAATIASILLFVLPASGVIGQAPEWEVDRLIGLHAGVCIREGPGLGYRAHTQVPEENWTVMVIDGPRQGNGKMWYDTSRNAAGDPSGGTGWVVADWSDTNCVSPPSATAAPANPPPPAPPAPNSSATLTGKLGEILQAARVWWTEQPEVIKWLVAILLLVATVAIWRRVGSSLVRLMVAVIEGLIIFWILDQTRSAWQDPWHGLVGPNAPDLAILLALIPLIAWMLSLIRKRPA